MLPGEEIPLEVLASGSRPSYFRYVSENENEDALQNWQESGLLPSLDARNVEEMKRDVPECQQNRTGCSDTLTETRQSDGAALPDWQQDGLLASVDPKNIRMIRRLRAMVDTRLHEALDAEDFEEAIRRALAAGTPLAALDYAGRTALHLCVHRRALGPFQVLLSYEGSANLGDADGCPVLNVAILHKWVDGARAALAAGADVTAITTILPLPLTPMGKYSQVLQEGALIRYPTVHCSFLIDFYKQTPIHLAVEMNELELLEEILDTRREAVDSPNLYEVTALYTAVCTKNLPAVKILLTRGAYVNKKQGLLHRAVRYPNILKYILDNTDVADSFDHNGYAALHQAVYINCPESVNFLLQRFNDPTLKIKRDNGMTALHLAARYENEQAAQVILQYDSSTVNELDDDGNTPLAIAADIGNKALILMMLKKGAVISTKSNKKETVIELIARRLLDCSNYFELVLDEFVYTDEFNHINVDYGFLTDTEGTSQIDVIEEFIRCGQSKLLLHPLIMTLLFLKWRHLRPVFCLIIGINFTFIISFNIFVVHTFYYRDRDSRNLTSIGIKTESREKELFEMHAMYLLLFTLMYGSIGAMLGLEMFHINLKRLRYFGHLESWVKFCVLALGAAVPYAVTVAEPADWLRHAACAALLLSWLQAMFLLAQCPYWGTYVLMYGKVAINLLKFLCTGVFLIIAFSFCFMIQFRAQSPFDGPFPALVKTLVMMSSEFDYEGLFGSNHDTELQRTRGVVRLLFLLFVIFLAMVLMNFMIGAAVSDIEDLNVMGTIKKLEMQVELLSILDKLVHGGLLDEILNITFRDCRYHDKIIIDSGFPVKWYVSCSGITKMLYNSEHLFQFYSKSFLFPLHEELVDVVMKNKKVQECKCNNRLCCNIGAVAMEGQKEEVNSNYSYNSDQIKVDGELLQPQPNIHTNRTYLHDQSLKIEQLTSDIASIKQMTSNMAACMKELTTGKPTLKIKTHVCRYNVTSQKKRFSKARVLTLIKP